MSYCRIGTYSDVYAYHDGYGISIHTAGKKCPKNFRRSRDKDPVKALLKDIAKYEVWDHPFAAKDYYVENAAQALGIMRSLLRSGVLVPKYAIKALEKEAKNG